MDPILNINLPIKNPIVSDKDLNAPFFQNINFYVLGGNGFIGSVIMNSISEEKESVFKTNARLEEVEKIDKELKLYKPKYVICSAGLTGTPNISWCETHKTETIETNITYQMTLAHLCKKKNIHLTIISSGVIFNNDRYYTERDDGNFNENFYGKSRIWLENMAKLYDNILYVRIIYPISKNNSSKNLITKLLSYGSIEKIEIAVTYLDELIPYLIDMILKGEVGVCNLVNDGKISLEEIIKIYEKESKHLLNKEIITLTETNKKSTPNLEQGKLKKYKTMNVKDAITDCIKNYLLLKNSFIFEQI
jgi:dTDP-4-dehydrorhamnose reductase